MSTPRFRITRGLALGGTALLAALAVPLEAAARPWGFHGSQSGPGYSRLPAITYPAYRDYPTLDPRSAHSYGDGYGGGYRAQAYPQNGVVLTEAELARRCNIGRLVGGLVGGGVGYAASRDDGRAWAVPLGALLGQQMGCSAGAGRGPVPW
jgi:hypothetical protein